MSETKNAGLALLEQLKVLIESEFSPEARIFHKPKGDGSGQALKVQLRLAPKWVSKEDGTGYFDREANKFGGLFLEIAPQGAKENGFATFQWRNEDELVRCKLGVPDISGLLVSLREVRSLGREVPTSLRDKSNPEAYKVSLFHKTATGSTIISYEFRADDSILRVAKLGGSGKKARSISLTLAEELVFERYLQLALDAHVRTGKR